MANTYVGRTADTEGWPKSDAQQHLPDSHLGVVNRPCAEVWGVFQEEASQVGFPPPSAEPCDQNLECVTLRPSGERALTIMSLVPRAKPQEIAVLATILKSAS